jgi:hypothetical protein
MPTEEEFEIAIEWALEQEYEDDLTNEKIPITKDSFLLVDKIREYFNQEDINCEPLCYEDIQKYL